MRGRHLQTLPRLPRRIGADDILKYNDDESYVYFYKRPVGAMELAAAEDAMAVCPENAIGDDGEPEAASAID